LNPSSVDPREALARPYLAEGKNAAAEDVLKQEVHDLPSKLFCHYASAD